MNLLCSTAVRDSGANSLCSWMHDARKPEALTHRR